MRTPLLLAAALAAAAPSVASAADPAPQPQLNCAVVVAPLGLPIPWTCYTQGNLPALSGATFARFVRLDVVSGSATATLSCLFPEQTVTVTQAKTGSAAATLYPAGDLCHLTVTPTAPGTVAVATSTAGYVFT